MHDRTETDTGPIPQQRTQTFVSGRTLSYAPPADQVDTSDAEWHAGGQVGDFVLLETLGRGAFGTVYLARQQSLDRLIALKVSAGGSAGRGEAVTLAGLEHDHIVKVFAEFTEEPTGRHCLCLQYVAGTNMADVIQDVHTRRRCRRPGWRSSKRSTVRPAAKVGSIRVPSAIGHYSPRTRSPRPWPGSAKSSPGLWRSPIPGTSSIATSSRPTFWSRRMAGRCSRTSTCRSTAIGETRVTIGSAGHCSTWLPNTGPLSTATRTRWSTSGVTSTRSE